MKISRTIILALLIVVLIQCDVPSKKWPAKFCESKTSEISKKRKVFVSYYEAAPFEYQDSIFKMKLVFKEVYTEWVYWYDEKDKKFKRDTMFNSQQFIAIYDTSQTILGEIDTQFYAQSAPFPIKYWAIENPGHGAQSEGFYGFGFYPWDKNCLYGDTIIIPITASFRYKDIARKDISNVSFGKIVFVRKQS